MCISRQLHITYILHPMYTHHIHQMTDTYMKISGPAANRIVIVVVEGYY